MKQRFFVELYIDVDNQATHTEETVTDYFNGLLDEKTAQCKVTTVSCKETMTKLSEGQQEKKVSFFKVVHVNFEDELVSICRNSFLPAKFPVKYVKDEKTVPNVEGSKLFVFDSLENAKKFAYTMRYDATCQIWECEVENPTLIEQIPFLGSYLVDSVVLRTRIDNQ